MREREEKKKAKLLPLLVLVKLIAIHARKRNGVSRRKKKDEKETTPLFFLRKETQEESKPKTVALLLPFDSFVKKVAVLVFIGFYKIHTYMLLEGKFAIDLIILGRFLFPYDANTAS